MMRGDIGAGYELGLDMGRTTQIYASSVSITYDEQRKVYVGEMTSRGGIYRIEGADRGSIDTDMEQICREEYRQMQNEASGGKPKSFESGRQVRVKEGMATVSRHKENGTPVLLITHSNSLTHAKGETGGALKAVGSAVEMGEMIHSVLTGDWLGLILGGLISSRGGEGKKLFAAQFGGMLIVASSRAELKRKLTLQKNRRIQIIINHMRAHKEELEKRLNLADTIAKRIIEKKKLAMLSWAERVSPIGRTIGLRTELLQKKEMAKSLWQDRF